MAGLVVDHLQHRPASLPVGAGQDIRGGSRQIGFEIAPVPVGEDRRHRRVVEPDQPVQQKIGLRDRLHLGVLDAVVDGLDEVAGAGRAEPGGARLAVDLGGDRAEDVCQFGERRRVATGHDRGAVARPRRAAGQADAEEAEAGGGQPVVPAGAIAVVRIAGVDDDIAGFEQVQERVELGVDRRPRLDRKQDRAGPAQALHQGMAAVASSKRLDRTCHSGERVAHLRERVERRHPVAALGDIQGEVAADHAEADQADIRGRRHFGGFNAWFPGDSGRTLALRSRSIRPTEAT